MKAFTDLYQALDATTSTTRKVAALVRYFRSAGAGDAAWASYLLAGGKPRQVVATALLRSLACELAGIAPWLFEECYAVTGDLAEAIAYVLPLAETTVDYGLADCMENIILPLRTLSPAEQLLRIARVWSELEARQRFIFVKLVGGGFRVGVSKLLVQRALGEVSGLDPKVIAQRMLGYTDAKRLPDVDRYQALLAPDGSAADSGQPYPFFLAHPLQQAPDRLGAISDWLVEWKYDGIRAQLVKRQGTVWIWSRGEELLTERFPEIVATGQDLPDGTVLDGEILAWDALSRQPFPFNVLQRRIGRQQLSNKILAEAPVTFLPYDLLELDYVDIRSRPQRERRELLETLARQQILAISPKIVAGDWAALAEIRATARTRAVEGCMLKQLSARYGVGRTKTDGVWWKWKIDPLTADGILIYAQAGHGRRANVYTDYTFAVWNRTPRDEAEVQQVLQAIAERRAPTEGELQLVPFAKAYSGLTDTEFKQIDKLIRKTTVDKFGPVRSVLPSLVFELGFEGLAPSKRHKSGIATRFPRMLRIRSDKTLLEADTLASLQSLLDGAGVEA